MKSFKLSLAVVLLVGVASPLCAVSSRDVVAGIVTGVASRAGSYMIKKQGKVESMSAVKVAAALAALGTVTWQVWDNGCWRRGLVQATTAVATYMASMMFVPAADVEKKEERDCA